MLFKLLLVFTVVYGCEVDNVKRKDQEEFVKKGKFIEFVQKCEHKEMGWTVKTIGCLNKAGERHPLGATVDGQLCEVHNDGSGTAEVEDMKKWNDAPAAPPTRVFKRSVTQTAKASPKCEGRSEGVEWDEGNFRLSCVKNILQYVGCYTSDRTYIAAGSTGTMNKFTFKCEANENGIRIYPLDKKTKGSDAGLNSHNEDKTSKSEKAEKAGPPGVAPPGFEAFLPTAANSQPKSTDKVNGCKDHKEGEEWTVGSFKASCQQGKTQWLGCQKEDVFIPVNEQKKVSGFTYQCQSTSTGIKIQPLEDNVPKRPANACENHDDEQEWRSGNFLKRCVDGKTEFTGCFRNGDDFIPIGSQVEIGKFTFECRTTPTGAEVVPLQSIV
ncbi:unnamed protein product [Bursaphelenchus okinawaensis]|uniref:Abnormal cell migration protein 18-like fibronectin type I domain-containing protein n=1 Tax=Bursaphelenchus okinawaensis TaxID=465554 RepID=A0A811KV67_9BILA|nr:unnamed protein product [Bursaphelenchus okinawaensis]CAG9113839.1 unnamed protein product [Bursaphelenchus okinawaensis]